MLTLIVLYPYPFSKYFFNKYFFNEIEKNHKIKIEYHDLSEILHSNWKSHFIQKKIKKAKKFKNLKSWKKNLMQKTKKKKICIFNFLEPDTLNSVFIYYYLKKLKLPIIQYKSPEVFMEKSYKNLLEIFFKVLLIIHKPYKLYYIAKINIYRLALKLLKFEKIFILHSGKKKLAFNYFRSKKINYYKYNSSDYFNYINFEKKLINKNKNKNKNNIVFLDSNAPFFLDKTLFGEEIKFDIESWYNSLNKFLVKVEKLFKKKIVIVPHPRSRDFKNPYYNKRFRILRDKDATVRSIKNSYFNMSFSATTAVSYCIIYKKPINFIYNNQIINKSPRTLVEIKSLSKKLGTNILNIEDEIYKNKFNISVNKKIYENYKFDYLTTKITINKSCYELWKYFLKKIVYEIK